MSKDKFIKKRAPKQPEKDENEHLVLENAGNPNKDAWLGNRDKLQIDWGASREDRQEQWRSNRRTKKTDWKEKREKRKKEWENKKQNTE
jgi:hypothetical protein